MFFRIALNSTISTCHVLLVLVLSNQTKAWIGPRIGSLGYSCLTKAKNRRKKRNQCLIVPPYYEENFCTRFIDYKVLSRKEVAREENGGGGGGGGKGKGGTREK